MIARLPAPKMALEQLSKKAKLGSKSMNIIVILG